MDKNTATQAARDAAKTARGAWREFADARDNGTIEEYGMAAAFVLQAGRAARRAATQADSFGDSVSALEARLAASAPEVAITFANFVADTQQQADTKTADAQQDNSAREQAIQKIGAEVFGFEPIPSISTTDLFKDGGHELVDIYWNNRGGFSIGAIRRALEAAYDAGRAENSPT